MAMIALRTGTVGLNRSGAGVELALFRSAHTCSGNGVEANNGSLGHDGLLGLDLVMFK
jgi:hypothetical protein